VKLWVQRFLAYLRAQRNLSEHTLRAYRGDLAEFERLWAKGGGGGPSDLTRRRVRALLAAFQERLIGRSSLMRRIAALRSFIRYLIDEDALARDPFLNLPMPRREARLPRFLSEAETAVLLEKGVTGTRPADLRDRAILELLYSCGLRRSELSRLNVADLDVVGGSARVFGKGSRERIVPIGRAALSALKGSLDARPASMSGGSKPLFLNARGGRLGDAGVALIVRRCALRSGLLKSVSPHALRHSFATQMLDRGCDVRTLQEMLGHKSLSTTQVYTHTSLEMIRRVYKKSHPRAEPEGGAKGPDEGA
jgi:site-specific recombinase XerD